MNDAAPLNDLATLLFRDPARRGLVSAPAARSMFPASALDETARSIAAGARSVAIVTGFVVRDGDRIASETDGPPGALYLARLLTSLGIEAHLISDAHAIPQLQTGCTYWGLPTTLVHEFPLEAGPPESTARARNDAADRARTDAWIDRFLSSESGANLSHLIAIERAGPSHTRQSLLAQAGTTPEVLAQFDAEVPPQQRNRCHNMAGDSIDGHTAKTHRLFEAVQARRLPVTTIGIGDGGNEIGMGNVPWQWLRSAVPHGGRIACRIATDHLLVAGVSNWAAYALAAAVAWLRGEIETLAPQTIDAERESIAALVRDAGAVDGVTRRHEATVDGLPLETYLQALAGIRRRCGLTP